MGALVIDTSSWVSWLDGAQTNERLIEGALEEGRVHLPPVVAAELLSGRLGRRERQALTALLDDLPLVEAGRDHWYRVGRLRSMLRERGLTVSTPDAHVAQSALDLGAALLTEDAIFSKVAAEVPLRLAPAVSP